jgi:hypothetical protein
MLIVIFTIVADVDLVKGAPLEVPVTEFAPPLPVSFSYVEQVSRNLYNLTKLTASVFQDTSNRVRIWNSTCYNRLHTLVEVLLYTH